MRKRNLIYGVLRVPFDAIMTIAAFFVAYELRRHELFPFDFLGIHLGEGALDPLADYLRFTAIATIGLLILQAISGQYDLRTSFHPLRQLTRIGTVVSAWMMLIIAFFFITRELFFSRAVLAYAWGLTIIFIFIGRVLLAFLRRALAHLSRNRTKILFIGAGSASAKLAKDLKRDPGNKIIGALITNNSLRQSAKLRVLGAFSDLEKIHKKYDFDELFLVSGDLDKKSMGRLLAFCRENQIEFRFLPPILEIHSKNIDLESIDGLPIVYLKPSSLDGWGRVLKRGFDILGSIFGLIILSPVFLIVAIGVKISSPGPIIYRDYRGGRNKRRFVFYKFRSMRAELCDGDIDGTSEGNKVLEELSRSDINMRQGPLHKIKDDPRRTHFGNFIRRTSLDELPQFWNVLKGDMSLVGPRPHMTKEIKNYQTYHNRVFAIKPGITGVAQISGRSDLDFDEEVRLDLAYIENWSLLLDISILLKTIFVVLFRKHQE